MNFISIGGWCGTKIAFKDLIDEPSLPFDSVRSSIEGIIDCFENNFINFFPKEIKKETKFFLFEGFIGEYIGFYHAEHNLLNPDVIQSFKRKMLRLDEKIKKNNCIFLRTISRDNYDDELKYYKKLQQVIDNKYPNISYIICFILPNQNTTQYYKHLDDRTFLFTLNDLSCDNDQLKYEYKPIFDFIIHNNLFINIPQSNDIEIVNKPSRIWIIDGYPMVNYVQK